MADKYWWPSGGTGTSTGNWSSTTNWSSSSASYVSTTAPTSADNANFGSYSGATSFTVTVDTGAACLALVINNTNMALAGTGTWSIYGAVTVTSFASRTYTGAITFAATTSVALNFGTMTLASSVAFNGTGGVWTLASALNIGTGSLTLSAGTLNTAGFTVTLGTFVTSGSTTRGLNLGASTVVVSGAWNLNSSVNLTFTAGTSLIQLTGAGASISGGGLTYNDVSFTTTAMSNSAISGANTFNNLTFGSRSSPGIGIIAVSSNQIVLGTLTLPAPATAGSSRYQIYSNSYGTSVTITAAAVNLTDVDFRDITGAGAATWSGTRLGDGGGNSGITFPAAKTVYWNLAGTNNWNANGWATTQTGAPATTNFPLAQDTVIFTDTNPGSTDVVTINAAYYIGTLDFSLRTVTLNIVSSLALSVYGSTILSPSVSLTGSATWSYAGRGSTQVIISAGRTWTQPLTVSNIGGTVQLGDACTRSATATVSYGTLNFNNYALTCTTFASTNSNTRTLDFGASGSITVTGTGTVFNTATTTGLTISGTAPIVNVTNATATATTVTSGTTVGVSNLLSFNFTAGTYSLTTTASNLFKSLNFTGFAGIWATSVRSIYGDLTVSTGMTLAAGTSITTFAGTSGTQTITTNGKTLDFPITFNGAGGTFALNGALTQGSTRVTTLTNGTLDLAGYTYTCGSFATAAGTKNITFNGGTLTVPASGATAFNNAAPTGFTTTAGTGTGTLTMTSASAKTFVGGGSTYNCTLNQGGAGALTISDGGNTFNNITATTRPSTITFTSGTTNTFNNFNVNGIAGNLVTINASTAGSQATISKSSGTVSVDYLSIRDSNATGGATWNAGANSTDVSNNTGWIFGAAPVNVTVSPTTQNAAFTLRSVAISVATTRSVTRQTLTVTPHSVTASAGTGTTRSVTGQALVTVSHDVALSTGTTRSVTGQALTFTQHSIALSCGYTASVSGQNLNMAEHSVALLFGVDIFVTGQALYFAQHDVSLVTDHVLPVTGQALTFVEQGAVISCDYSTTVTGQNLFTAEHSVALSTEQVMQAGHQNIQSAVHGPKFWFPIDENQNANWGAINVTQTANWNTIDASQTPDWTDVET